MGTGSLRSLAMVNSLPLSVLCLMVLAASVGFAEPLINEIMANNQTTLADSQNEFDDWVEIYNPDASDLDLGGFYFSDDPDDVAKWRVPFEAGLIVPAGGYAVLWLDHDTEDGADHLPFRLASGGDVLILTDPDGATLIEQVSLPGQHPDISYGRSQVAGGEFRYLINPTPGMANDPTGVAVLEGVTFSKEAGTFGTAFDLVLSTTSAGATIRYTLDGSLPTSGNGEDYDGAITVSVTSCVRAALFLGETQISPVETRIFLAVADDMTVFDSNLPIVLLDSQGYDYSGDDDPRTDYPPQPVCSAMIEVGDSGRAGVLDPAQFVGRAGMNVRGASSKTWPKKQFKFETWDEEDNDRDVSLLGMPAESDWLLQAPYFDKTLMRNEFVFHWWRAMGYYSPRTRYVEVFLNPEPGEPFGMEHYQGVYLLTEKIKRSEERMDLTRLDADDIAEPDITGGYMVQATNLNEDWVSGEGTRYKYVDPGEDELVPAQVSWLRNYIEEAENSVYAANFADPVNGYSKYLDVASQIDYDIMRELSRNTDGASTFFSIDRGGKLKIGPLWDYNQALGLSSLGTSSLGYGYETFGWNGYYMRAGHWLAWWNELDDDPVYQQAWNDRWVELREGILATDQLLEKIDGDAALLDEAQVRNFDQWDILGVAVYVVNGRTRADPGDLDRDTYEKEVSFLRNWVEDRVAWIDSQVPSPPDFSRNGGAVVSGFSLEISEGTTFAPFAGDIFYTIDGSDPSAPGSLPYSAPLVLTESVLVKARTKNSEGNWSSLREATFIVGTEPPSRVNLTISEIHYNPEGSDDLEFIEIANRGNSPVNLSGVRLSTAVEFAFSELDLMPNEVVLVVEDEGAFRAVFSNPDSPRNVEGISIAGQWTGRLNNAGEQIDLRDSQGSVIHSVSYGQDGDWPSEADGKGFSLEQRDLHLDPAMSESWRLSAFENGTPGLVPSLDASTFESWRALNFSAEELADPQISGTLADPDGDGLSNLLEFGLASLPRQAETQAPIQVATEEIEVDGVSGSYLTLTFHRPAHTGLTYTLQKSSDLLDWENRPMILVRSSFDPDSQIERMTVREQERIISGERAQLRIRVAQ